MANVSALTRRYAGPIAVLLGLAWIVAYFLGTFDGVRYLGRIDAWHFVIGFAVAFLGVAGTLAGWEQRGPGTIGNRWAAPMMIASAVIGLVWIITFYVIAGSSTDVPIITDLNNANILVGMGFIVAAFAFAMKWE